MLLRHSLPKGWLIGFVEVFPLHLYIGRVLCSEPIMATSDRLADASRLKGRDVVQKTLTSDHITGFTHDDLYPPYTNNLVCATSITFPGALVVKCLSC